MTLKLRVTASLEYTKLKKTKRRFAAKEVVQPLRNQLRKSKLRPTRKLQGRGNCFLVVDPGITSWTIEL